MLMNIFNLRGFFSKIFGQNFTEIFKGNFTRENQGNLKNIFQYFLVSQANQFYVVSNCRRPSLLTDIIIFVNTNTVTVT